MGGGGRAFTAGAAGSRDHRCAAVIQLCPRRRLWAHDAGITGRGLRSSPGPVLLGSARVSAPHGAEGRASGEPPPAECMLLMPLTGEKKKKFSC